MPLPTPVQRQREVVCLPASGHTVVLGTAGSGKTTMAILRAKFLTDPELPSHGSTLLLTFNKALVSFIRALAAPELRGVTVEHFHKFARGYMGHRGKLGYGQILEGRRRDAIIRKAITKVKNSYKPHPFFSRTLAYFAAELSWLAQHGISSSDDYVSSERIGRANARMEEKYRPIMWAIRDAYVEERKAAGFLYDWDDLATAVREELLIDGNDRMYRHIVVDEGQDFSPEMLRCLSAAVPPSGSLTFFGDVAQQIYGHRMSWRSAGLSQPRVWKFSENYRNTAEISALGLAIASQPYYAALPDMVTPTSPAAEGSKPTLVRASTEAVELSLISEQATRRSTTQSVGVLVRTNRQVEILRRILPSTAIPLKADSDKWIDGPNLYYGTLHSAKGLEFDVVLLPFASVGSLPDPQYEADFGLAEADANDGRLLYVGVTRAKSSLIISYVGAATRLLPTDASFYTVAAR